ncbi:hypothetical protein SLS62_008205 [Diatrype stigma]|uniref:Rab-GAP TBC domain-containing protein n=1 Tax=Diatrype stigma TaxID=117547 RepID=A0AAN9UKT0_9PEZI
MSDQQRSSLGLPLESDNRYRHLETLVARIEEQLLSPWNTLRRDEILRAEILQDVQRLPEVPFYHEPRIQALILDVLFIYCKLNPDVGGYRQGMHELLAPIVYVLDQDAINPVDAASKASADLAMVEMLDATFIEHDAFALFSKLMDHAKVFYEVGETASKDPSSRPGLDQQPPTSTIVEKSQYIHEVCLRQVDPELSDHLKNIEVLPQVFLIRWVRLLFSREFPFEQVLVLWDNLFAVDPTFELLDLICTAMLMRIRWDHAVYLRDHLDTSGGSALITKYTGRSPIPGADHLRSDTPRAGDQSMRRKATGARSPLSPSRFIQQQGGMEALFQGAAKGVLERGEKLGINQAVRDAMLEIRRNVSEAKTSMKANRELHSESRPSTATRSVTGIERRNKQLAAMLEDTVSKLKTLATSPIDDEKKHREELEVATAKIQFVRVYLEDSTMALPEPTSPRTTPVTERADGDSEAQTSELLSEAVSAMNLNSPSSLPSPPAGAVAATAAAIANPDNHPPQADPDVTDTDPLGLGTATPIQRPQGPNPTRSTLAQSSFSWMLEPGESTSSLPSSLLSPPPSSSSQQGGASSSTTTPGSRLKNSALNRKSVNAARERTAFLFGEVPTDEKGQPAALPDDMFGMELMGKSKS